MLSEQRQWPIKSAARIVSSSRILTRLCPNNPVIPAAKRYFLLLVEIIQNASGGQPSLYSYNTSDSFARAWSWPM